MPRRVTKKDKEVIRHMIEIEGATLEEVGRALGDGPDAPLSKQAVHYHVQKMGLKKAEDEDKVFLRQVAEEVLSTNPEISIKALATELETSWQVAKSILQELGYYNPTIPFVKRVNAKRLVHLYVVEDMSLQELAKEFSDVSEMTLSKTLKELGVPMRPQGASSGDLRAEWRRKTMSSLGLQKS